LTLAKAFSTELVDGSFPSEVTAGHGRRLSAEKARFGTSGAFALRPKFGDGWRTGTTSVVVFITVFELELRFLTGDDCRDGEEGCLRGEGFRRPAATIGATGGVGATVAALYLEVISLFRSFRTAVVLVFSAAGNPPK
jgi:hypothetical protein